MRKLFVFVFLFVLAVPVSAQLVYRGPVGAYVPQPGEVVVEQLDGNLQVSRPDGSVVTIHITTLSSGVPAQPAQPERHQGPRFYSSSGQTGDQFVYRKEHRVGDGSIVYYDPNEQVVLRKQDVDELETLSDISIDQRRQSEREAREQYRRRSGWSKEARDWNRDLNRQSERKARQAEAERKALVRERERAQRELSRVIKDARQDAERRQKDRQRQLEKLLQSQR